jgi:hypothetical protein
VVSGFWIGSMADAVDLSSVMATLLDGAEQQLGTIVRDVVRPFVEDAFRKGVRAGINLSRESTIRGYDVVERGVEKMLGSAPRRDEAEHRSESASSRHAQRRRRRVARGTVRPLVELVLSDRPGLRVNEVQAGAVLLDPTISPTSVGNELRRLEGQRYRREGKRWFLIGDTGKRKAEDRSLADGADLSVERPDYAAA